MKADSLIAATCPACAYPVAAGFFDGGRQPLATLGWPQSGDDAQAMPRFPHDFVQCPQCTHVWNRSFTYDAVPYRDNPNRMFNQGSIWGGHLAATRDLILSHLPDQPTVVDIGCGEGHFARGLAAARGGRGRFMGFDPNMTAETGAGVEFHPRLFEPLTDMPALSPDAIAIRHVLEHLTDPASLLAQLAWGATASGKECWLFAETPCIDRVFHSHRLADFFYEHLSHFTTRSFEALMARAGEIVHLAHGYDGEVVYALVKLKVADELRATVEVAAEFALRAIDARDNVRRQMDQLAASGQSVAIWGGTGKAAAFMHQFGADAERFPLVVDSDAAKVGTFVPGTGQPIRFRDELKARPVDVVIIPTQWRARDIIAEMRREGIVAGQVLIEHDGGLVAFDQGDHPYR